MQLVYDTFEKEFKEGLAKIFLEKIFKIGKIFLKFINQNLNKMMKKIDMLNFQDGFLGMRRYVITKRLTG